MKTTKAMASGMLVVLTAILGCSRGDAHADQGALQVARQAGAVSSHSYAFGGAGVKASSRVERQITANGGEVLRGTTEVTISGAAHPTVVHEVAELDASGRLVRATSELRTGATEVVRSVELDAIKGTVTVRDQGGERDWLVAEDHPWTYAGLFDDVAPHASGVTAVQAWVARRAAQAGTRIRAIEVLAHRSSLTLSDQVVFQDGDTDLVVLGDEVAETDRDFVRSLPWKALETFSDELRAAESSCDPGPV